MNIGDKVVIAYQSKVAEIVSKTGPPWMTNTNRGEVYELKILLNAEGLPIQSRTQVFEFASSLRPLNEKDLKKMIRRNERRLAKVEQGIENLKALL